MNRTLRTLILLAAAVALVCGAACKPYLEKLDEESKKKAVSADINDRVEQHLQNAKMFAKSESFHLASEEYRTIIEKYPQFDKIAEVYYRLSRMQYALGERDAQIKALHEVIQREANHEAALYDLAEAYLDGGNLAKAEEYAQLAREANRENPRNIALLEKIRKRRSGEE